MLLADIFITYKDRESLFEESFKSFVKNTQRELYRLTVICDGHGIPNILRRPEYAECVDHILDHSENMGLGPSINQALAHIDAINRYYDGELCQDKSKVSDFICYCQDDLLYSEGWLKKLASYFMLFEKPKKIGFASGVECIEHKIKEDLGNGFYTKDWIRAAQMFARREYWMSMYPIPRFDPETGRVRAKPNDGMGSGVDWWFIRNHDNSVCKTDRTCLVVPGLVTHLGYDQSTWLSREMPESEADKRRIKEYKADEHGRLSQEIQDYEW